MKRIKSATEKIQKKNLKMKKQIEKKSDKLKFKTGDPNRLNIYW